MHEWPLVIFTLLMQASIGCLAVALLCKLRLGASLNDAQSANMMRAPLLFAFVFGAAGLLASLLHLGNPLHMFYTLMHVSSSWMSREVLLTGSYMGLLFLTVALLLVKKKLSMGLVALSVLVGLLDVYAMSAIYANTLFTLWGGWFTFAGFYGTTLLLGGIIACLLIMPGLKSAAASDSADRVLRICLAVCVMGILLFFVSASSLLTQIGEPVSMGISNKVLPEGLFNLTLLRAGLVALGLFVVGRLLCKQSETVSARLILASSACCIIAGELVGRYVFFSLGA